MELQKQEKDGLQSVTKWICGPFDPPEDYISLVREMIEHVGWQQEFSAGDR
jgi:hypothetical protein